MLINIFIIMEKLNEEQSRILYLFSYYCRGYIVDEVDIIAYVNNCQLEYIDNQAYSKFNSSIELYDSIKDLLSELLENSGVLDEIGNCESSGNIVINIDCVERTINLEGSYNDISTDDHYFENDIIDIDSEEIYQFFKINKDNGFEFGRISFNGSGDSGWIENTIVYNDDTQEDYPSEIRDYLYDFLSDSLGGGWEINEGSQGEFTLNFDEDKIELNAGINNESETSTGSLFFSKF
jgi:hypothetical protein